MHVTEKNHLYVGKLRAKKADNFGKVWEREGKYAREKIIEVKGIEGQQQIVGTAEEKESTTVKVQVKEENCKSRNMLEKEEKPIREKESTSPKEGEFGTEERKKT